MPTEYISEKHYPKVFAWIVRYRSARERLKILAPEPTKLDGVAAAEQIHSSEFAEPKLSVDAKDPVGLEEGTEVELFATDWGTEHRDCGRLVGLTADEAIIAVKSKGDIEIRIHAPRTGFTVKAIGRKAGGQ